MAKKSYFKLPIFTILLVAGGFYLYQNFGSIITRTAEKVASNALGVNVDIGNIRVSLGNKTVTVNTLQVSNPPGYRGAHAMTADQILIGFNNANQELIDFNDIQVKGSVVNLEVNERGMNLVDLKKLANEKKQKESVGAEQIRVIIKRMVIEASTINPTISFSNKPLQSITMPALSFSNIGSGNGITAKAAIIQVLSKYLTEAQDAARDSGMLNGLPGAGYGHVEEIKQEVKKKLDGAGKELQRLFE